MAMKPECIAMLLAGGQGSRLGILTQKIAKPAVPYGGKYRIIDFPLSNCVNSGINTVGVLTQYQPLELNDYIGNGQPWDLDRNIGGVPEERACHFLSLSQKPPYHQSIVICLVVSRCAPMYPHHLHGRGGQSPATDYVRTR